MTQGERAAQSPRMELIRRALSAYGIEPVSAAPAGGTAGATWRVKTADADYFVRRRGARTATPERAAYDHGLRRHLADSGFCATPPLDTRDGRTWVEIEGAMYEAYPWVEGLQISDGLTDLVRVPVADTLARFHEKAASYQALCEERVPQFTNFEAPVEPRPRFDDPEAFLDVIEHMLRAYCEPHNRDAMLRARDLTLRLAQEYGAALYDSLPRGVIHGDYNRYNLLFAANGRVVGVFDFDWAWREARVRDVAEAVLFFGARRSAPTDTASIWSLTAAPRFDLDPMLDVARAYDAKSPLTPEERRALPLAMLARWVSMRTEGIMKVPPDHRAEFLLMSFEEPFKWRDAEGEAFVRALG